MHVDSLGRRPQESWNPVPASVRPAIRDSGGYWDLLYLSSEVADYAGCRHALLPVSEFENVPTSATKKG